MRRMEPYNVPGPMRTCPSLIVSTSCAMAYPCRSPSARASRMWRTAGVSGRRLSGVFLVMAARDRDISVVDI